MIVCSCNVISDKDLADGIAQARQDNPHRPLTVGLVYKALGKKLNCAGCLPLTMQILADLDSDGGARRPSRRRRRRATGGAGAGFRAAASPDSH